ncbi:MAG: ATP-binding cassette domain-containing protein, partial [Solobacterium sp.]|nr:ATP-binding cassette domain-containing protein [Solobacterium sp.]
MSILTVEHLSHSFGGRVIFEDVSFRMNRGEHIGLVGANGEGKSTFMNILTRKLEQEEGKVIWAKRVKAGYLDQHTVLEKGKSIGEVLSSAYNELFDIEQSINDDYMKMCDMSEEEMNELLEDIGSRQEYLELHDFYLIDSKVAEVARAFDLDINRKVDELSGGQRSRVLLAKLLLEKPDILLLDEPTNYLDKEHIDWFRNYLIN